MTAPVMLGLFLTSLCLQTAPGVPAQAPVSAPPEKMDRGGIQPFAPGVRIDWTNLTVELEAEVVLREGPLELFACSPKTKEHESILVVYARGTQVYQALGLIGLSPGSPPRYDQKTETMTPARGDGLELRVRYTDETGSHVVGSRDWVAVAHREKLESPATLPWVFAGSLNSRDGRLAADVEGTLAGLVDFESSLIALAGVHSADNEELWLVANRERIPPRGTKCVLLIRSHRRPVVRVSILPDGTLRQGDRILEVGELTDQLKPSSSDPRPAHLRVCQEDGTSDETKERVIKAAQSRGFEGLTEVKRPPCRFDGEPSSDQPPPD